MDRNNIKHKVQEQFKFYAKQSKKIRINSDLLNRVVEWHSGCAGYFLGFFVIDGVIYEDSSLYDKMLNLTIDHRKSKKIKFSNEPRDIRRNIIKKMISKAVLYAKTNNEALPKNTYMLIFVADRNIWNTKGRVHMDEILSIPIFCFAKAKNENNPLFPDSVFEEFSFTAKYKGECSWDETVRIIKQKVANIHHPHNDNIGTEEEKEGQRNNHNNNYNTIACNNQKPLLYFKGAITGQYSNQIRQSLFDYHQTHSQKSKSQEKSLIVLDQWKPHDYTPVYEWCKYKYLLSLPGHYPWSNRLKLLFLLDSIVINVAVRTTHYLDEFKQTIDYCDETYITFADLFIEDSLYLNYVYELESYHSSYGKVWIDPIGKIQKLYAFLQHTVTELESNSEMCILWQNKNQQAKQILETLNEDAISMYIIECLHENANIVEIDNSLLLSFPKESPM